MDLAVKSSSQPEKQTVLDIWEDHYNFGCENTSEVEIRQWMRTSPADVRRGIVLVAQLNDFQSALTIKDYHSWYEKRKPPPLKEWTSIVSLLAIVAEESEKEWYWVAKVLREQVDQLDSVTVKDQKRIIQIIEEDTKDPSANLVVQEAYMPFGVSLVMRNNGTTPFVKAFHDYVCQLERTLAAWLWAHIKLDELPKAITRKFHLLGLPEFMEAYSEPIMPDADPKAFPDELIAAFDRWKVFLTNTDRPATAEEDMRKDNQAITDKTKKALSAVPVAT